MNEFTITKIISRQILDSRGNPTVEADVYLSGGAMGRAAVPSGASTGSKEALELRDGGDDWSGKGVRQAIKNIEHIITPKIIGLDANNQTLIDQIMLDLDGTKDKSNLGANAILAVSLACAKATANQKQQPFYKYIAQISGTTELSLPMPMMNIMNGGSHATGSSDIQEYMIIPKSAKTFEDALKIGTEIFHSLKKVLIAKNYATTVGDEGGYAPKLQHGNQEPLELIKEACLNTKYVLGQDVVIALDVAASEFKKADGYHLATENLILSASELIKKYQSWIQNYSVVSIEDGLDENDWDNWTAMTAKLGDTTQLVGDDLLVTNVNLLKEAIAKKACNAILIKPNQIGSLTETIQAVKLAQNNGIRTVMSHRSGETEDTTIAHLAVGLNTGQIKTGSLSRTDRVAKYNEILRIAENSEIQLAQLF